MVCKRDKPGQETRGKGWEASGSPAHGTELTERHLLCRLGLARIWGRGLWSPAKATGLFCGGVVHGRDMRTVERDLWRPYLPIVEVGGDISRHWPL